MRLLSISAGSDIDGNEVVLGPTDNVEETTLVMNSGSIDEHTLVL